MLSGILSSACAAVALATAAGSVPYGLSVEYRKNPVGIDSPAPRLSWKLPDAVGRQTAYEIEADGWRSGKDDSDQSLNVVWKGRSIGTSARVNWRVRVWDEKGAVSDWSRPASFVAGVMDSGDWKARWIGPNRIELVSPAFEKRFAVSGKVARATLHVTGVGFYEARLNGLKVGDKVLDPSPTEYRKRVLYSTYLLDDALRQGDNILTILVGHGWYDVRSDCHWKFNRAPWRDVPRTLAQLEIEYADGRREVVVTDGSWQQVASPVAFDCIREGEVVGVPPAAVKGRALLPLPAAEMPAPEGRLVAEAQPGAKVMRTIRPTAIHASTGGLYVVEFPEDLAGWVRLRLRGQRCGDVVTIRYDERINAGFTPAVRTFGDAHVREARPDPQDRRVDCYFHDPAASDIVLPGGGFQTDRFVCSGAAEETYEPRFTYSGFRYALISGLRTPPTADDVVACEVRTAFDVTGSFESSDATLDALVRMADRAYRSNFTDGVPTDCPHREKNGWTGDASLVCEMAQYLYENTAGYEKWLGDLLDAQRPKGDLPAIVPTAGWGYDWGTGPVWDSALWVIPWNLYCYRGDREALSRAYPALKRYLGYLSGRLDKDGLFRGGLGDWVAPNQKEAPSARFVESAYAYQAFRVAVCMARRLGAADEARAFAERASEVRTALRKRFLRADGVWDNGGQTAQSLSLTFAFFDGDVERRNMQTALVRAVERKDGHVDVGVVGMKHLFRALSEAGRSDLALKLLLNETPPSPTVWLKRGGTSLWEDWQDGASRNHAMFGDFAAWAYQCLAGIRLAEGGTPAVPDPFEPAFRAFTLAPQVVDGLDHVSASTETPYGTIRCAWRRNGESIRLSCTVPAGTTALLRLPNGEGKRLLPGKHELSL